MAAPSTPSPRYLVVGAGRMAANLMAYLKTTDCAFAQWSRRADGEATLETATESADIVLLAVSDRVIAELAERVHAANCDTAIVHFSAVVDAQHAGVLHPPIAFPPEPLSSDFLKSIPFVQIEGGVRFGDIFPKWTNPVFTINGEDRALYHAILVLAGNLPQLLWSKAAAVLDHEAGLDPMAILQPYIASNAELLKGYPAPTFGGPVARRDEVTIAANLAALDDFPDLNACYELLLTLGWPERGA